MVVQKLRWVLRKYPLPTIDEVKKLKSETGLSMNDCKAMLYRPTEKVLQQFIITEFNGHTKDIGEWVDVPVVEEVVAPFQ